ncbi:MAG: sulfatase-like hydrolase/transferase [Planctomycetes bacterium]|nr:sulfatase-like hydrolase/transferase [Planctomycetota bacterium]
MPAPNILFIFTDEQRSDTLAAYGNTHIHTPNLDSLAARSVLFENAYVTQPVCTPSRSTIMTGLYPHSNSCTANNVPLPPHVPTIAELWNAGSHKFGYHGKWHLGDEIFRQHGFDEWVSIEDLYRRYYSTGRDRSLMSDYSNYLASLGYVPGSDDLGPFFRRRFSSGLPVEHTKPMFLAREASRFITENRNDPFVLYVNFLEPHMPFSGPYDRRRSTNDVVLPGNHAAFPDNEPLHNIILRRRYRELGFENHDLSSVHGWKRILGNYWGLVELVDEAVGVILSTLSAHGLDDNTIVVFTSDHGDMMGSHGILAKTVMFEEAVKVPLLMRIPGVPPGRVPFPVSQADLVPTLLDYCSGDVPDSLQGYSLRNTIDSGTPPAEDHVFIEWNGPDRAHTLNDLPLEPGLLEHVSRSRGRTVISPDGWKLNLNENDRHELYCLASDPAETVNLFPSASHAAAASALADKLLSWQQRTGDDFPVVL